MAKKKSKTAAFKPGIFAFEPAVDPKSLKPHKLNWRKHSHRQRQAFGAHKKRVGWTDAVVLNVTTGNIVDGHMRREEAIKNGEPVPLLKGRWTEEQEKEILAMKDPLGAMAETQADALQNLTEQVNAQLAGLQAKSKDILTKFTADLDTYADDVMAGEAPSVLLHRKVDRAEYDRARAAARDDEDEDDGIEEKQLKDDPIFSSSNRFGIPDLLPDCFSTEVPRTVWDRSKDSARDDAWFCYSAGPKSIEQARGGSGGFLGFFTEDFRFERCWSDTARFTEWLRDMDFAGVVQPDFSTWSDWPVAVRMHNVYRSRWCARYFQEAGIPIVPIIQGIGACPGLDGKATNSFSTELCIGSLPKKIPVLATEARNSQGAENYWASWAYLHKIAISHLQPKALVIYGGEENQKRFISRLGKVGKTELVLLSSFISQRRKGSK